MHSLDDIRDDNGKLPSCAWPGGYPILYQDKHGSDLCPDCANRDVDDSQACVGWFIHYEGAPVTCDDCGEMIESAYGDPAEETD